FIMSVGIIGEIRGIAVVWTAETVTSRLRPESRRSHDHACNRSVNGLLRQREKRGQVLRRASNSTHGAGTLVSRSSRVSFTSKTISGWPWKPLGMSGRMHL